MITKPNGSLTLDLVHRDESVSSAHSQHHGKLTVHAEECFTSKTTAEMTLSCLDLESKDLFSKSVCIFYFKFYYFLLYFTVDFKYLLFYRAILNLSCRIPFW